MNAALRFLAPLAFVFSFSFADEPAAKLNIPDGVTFAPDIVYGTGGGEELKLDMASPKEPGAKRPCVVVIHGGAWRGGERQVHRDQVLNLAKEGYVAVTIQYRLLPKYRFPAQIEDAKCAVRYLRANAEKYGLDPDRIGAVGYSAGAHLAMMLGVTSAEDGLEGEGGNAGVSSRVQVVVSFAGPTSLGAEDIPPVSVGLVSDFLGGTRYDLPEIYKKASPISFVTSDDAPIFLTQGTKDQLIPTTQAVAMMNALTDAGVPGHIELILGADHGWGEPDISHTMRHMSEFLGRYLKK